MKTTDILLLALLGAIGYLIWRTSKGQAAEAPMISVEQTSRMDFSRAGGGGMPFGDFLA